MNLTLKGSQRPLPVFCPFHSSFLAVSLRGAPAFAHCTTGHFIRDGDRYSSSQSSVHRCNVRSRAPPNSDDAKSSCRADRLSQRHDIIAISGRVPFDFAQHQIMNFHRLKFKVIPGTRVHGRQAHFVVDGKSATVTGSSERRRGPKVSQPEREQSLGTVRLLPPLERRGSCPFR